MVKESPWAASPGCSSTSRNHRNHAVNLARIQEIRRRKGGEDWELKLEPPVNRVLPVSRGEVGKLLRAFGRRE